MTESFHVAKRALFVYCGSFLAVLCILSVAAAQPSEGRDQPEVLLLSKARDGRHIIFEIAIRRPEDVDTMTIERQPWTSSRTIWPSVASADRRSAMEASLLSRIRTA